MQIEFNKEIWELYRMPGYWMLERHDNKQALRFYNYDSLQELKKRLKEIEKNG